MTENEKVKKLVEKAKKGDKKSQVNNDTIEDVLYGARAENDNAVGPGEFDS